MTSDMRGRQAFAGGVCLLLGLTILSVARADVVPPPADLPAQLSLDDALRIFRSRGLDLLIADAQVVAAEGDVKSAGAVQNPTVSVSYGRVFTYNPDDASCRDANCSANQLGTGLSDQGAIENSLSGKRGLRLKVARAALAATKLARADAERTLEFQVKQQYVQVAQAQAALELATQVVDAARKVLELNRLRYPKVINEGDLARIETAELESEQALDIAKQNVRVAQVGLAYLLGVRGKVPDFRADVRELDYRVPGLLARTSEEDLLRIAFERRPDLKALGFLRDRASAAIALAKRQRVPDIALSVNYAQTGSGGAGTNAPLQPPTLTFGLTAPLPIFYQQQGEVRRAEADYNVQSLEQAKTVALVASDVGAAFASFTSSKSRVERAEKILLDRAKTARNITEIQFNAGAATLMDFLDAQRTFIRTSFDALQSKTNYWTAVFQLEQAVGVELRK
jgi:cobalt-zinc-cadmium efflux system outer membrane protein